LRSMVRSLRSLPLLRGVRGQLPADLAALAQVLLALGLLAHDLPELAEADINPLPVLSGGRARWWWTPGWHCCERTERGGKPSGRPGPARAGEEARR